MNDTCASHHIMYFINFYLYLLLFSFQSDNLLSEPQLVSGYSFYRPFSYINWSLLGYTYSTDTSIVLVDAHARKGIFYYFRELQLVEDNEIVFKCIFTSI